MIGALAEILYEGGRASWYRATGIPPFDIEGPMAPRRVGEPIISLFNLDLAYQDEVGDIEAIDGRLEVGYGPVGVDLRWTRYREQRPRDALDLVQSHVLYRMVSVSAVEVDLGVGVYVVDGTYQHTGASITLPIWLQLHEPLSVEARLGWAFFESSNLSDHTLRLRLGRNSVAAWAGHRWVAIGEGTLKGPTVGLSLY